MTEEPAGSGMFRGPEHRTGIDPDARGENREHEDVKVEVISDAEYHRRMREAGSEYMTSAAYIGTWVSWCARSGHCSLREARAGEPDRPAPFRIHESLRAA